MFPSLMMSCHVPIDPCHLSLTHVSLVSGVWSLARHILDVSYARCKRKLHLIISLIYNNDRLSNCWKLKRYLKLNINFINFEKIPWFELKHNFLPFFHKLRCGVSCGRISIRKYLMCIVQQFFYRTFIQILQV